jgi:hypothetical protein
MGIVVVLIFYAVAITIAASVGSALFSSLAYFLTKRSGARRKRAIIACALFPFTCALFAGTWFVVYATVNYEVFDRDPGLGDGWQTPLPNGYALSMIDTTDQGTVYNPKTQSGNGSISSGDDAVFGARQLQVAGPHIFGARDTGYFGRLGKDSKFVDSYFELDTSLNKVTEFRSVDDLRKHASAEGVTLNLRAFESVFGDYRTTWFDYLAGFIFIAVPLVGFVLLSRWIWRIRVEGQQAALRQNPAIR